MPSSVVGKKLDAKLKEKNRGVWIKFIRLAAALILVAVSVYVVRSWNHVPLEESTFQVVNDAEPTKNEAIPIPHNSTDLSEEPNLPLVNATEPIEPIEDMPVKQEVQTSSKPSKHEPLKIVPGPTLAVTDQTDGIIEEKETNEPPESLTTQEIEDLNASRPKVTITYKRSPASPERTLTQHDPSDKKTKGLKKLWRKAQSFHNNDLSLAGIRGTKDEILAFDKKEKTKESKSN